MAKIGSYKYSRHKSTSVLCCAYAINDEPTKLIPFEDFNNAFFGTYSSALAEIYDYANSGNITFNAHNATFERNMWHNVLVRYCGAPRIPIARWRCTLAKCAFYSLPKSLDDAAHALELGHKFKEGKKAMMRLTKTKEPSATDPSIWVSDPAKFNLCYEYCKGDVDLEREIDNTLPDLPEREQLIWYFDQNMNDRGIPIDVEGVALVQEKFNEFMDASAAEFTRLTNCTPKQVIEFRNWLSAWGLKTTSVDAEHVIQMLDHINDDIQENCGMTVEEWEIPKRALELRQLLGATTSISKLSSMLDYAADDDGRVRDAFQFSSGITHRWGGKAIQPQNLPRITDENEITEFERVLNEKDIDSIQSIDQIKKGMRAFIQARPGTKLLIGDYSQIEIRVNMYLSKEEKGLVKFRNDEDLYVDMAQQIHKNPKLTKKDKQERQLGKCSVLGCGFQMGAPKFQATAKKPPYNLSISLELAEQTVAAYRGYYTKIVDFWYEQERCAIAALESGNRVGTSQGIAWEYKLLGPNEKPYLVATLPSGTQLFYYKPWITHEPFFGREKATLNYFKVDPQSGRSVATKTYGGKLVENIVQAVARDVMAAAMLRITRYNKTHGTKYNIIMTVHDELVAEVPDDDRHTEEEFMKILVTREAWFADAPVAAEVKTAYRYTK